MPVRPRVLAPIALACLIALSGCVSAPPTTRAQASAPPAHWTYEGVDGPGNWGKLSAAYQECGVGEEQSPIDLPAAVPASTQETAITLAQPTSDGHADDTGHTGQFWPAHPATTLSHGGRSFELKQLHYHTPSEHTIAGKPAAAEFHFVHEDAAGHHLVLAVLGQKGKPTPGMDAFVNAATAGEDVGATLNFESILPAASAYYTYEGSLTTPPCSQSVPWIVLSTPITLSEAQLTKLEKLHGEIARPVNPIGERSISGGSATVKRG
ncbi:MAG: carbonic anhydrase family protein [Propioniciclava sp.]|uniref:carbonic anhydrase n=1 Tax=Propioniciclava sp. TaxID=2038686 RepID=UPI0039E4ADC9